MPLPFTEHPGPKGLLVSSSYFLGDPPPDPRFLASLGGLSLVELDHCSRGGNVRYEFDASRQ
jgi:hypothetical protein